MTLILISVIKKFTIQLLRVITKQINEEQLKVVQQSTWRCCTEWKELLFDKKFPYQKKL